MNCRGITQSITLTRKQPNKSNLLGFCFWLLLSGGCGKIQSMIYFEAMLLGIVQGVTEFLPISSTGHVYLVETAMGLVPDVDLVLWLHLGSLLAVIGYFWRDLWQMIVGTLQMLQEGTSNEYGEYSMKLLLATVATAPTALVVREWFPYSQMSLSLVGVTLLVTAGLIYVAEYWQKQSRSLSWMVIILLGLIQGLAVLPGISRSGLTIAFLIWMGVSRQLAARTSFLLSIPTIMGAGLFSYFEQGERFTSLGLFEITAVASSAAAAYLAIVWMMKWIEGKWIYFAYYCAALGLVVMFL